ncbi:heavy metal translocating P-type ATPase [Phaeobacter gallaeciensis]|uniref:P-type Cu(2+) transporter n=1 Tax=Phaeobacter gallaeciensis TaxID=60890 RepID=A0AAC9ZC39_9RHOB|nr:heavy metal translocating P-type ATPase [Phaeobacter gallaeciensis]AHD10981.1 copper-(or silver)-translocating P-type ATPase [Phaeobacter gallaeciensis DSM 26640]ATE94244.1 copper-transporting P-type ATPase ActP [Phaeobacter gallaeciensis]ATE95935.1 copper-transporting P-type ATPase ActP [Phaeobacter gallaeciensis]ATF02908.1 copper-transporting P-type ATPase ActP [Phaeobacter gallaeciensis]ATF07288.1 copper-transporting P-type ATPase ActP [Phaeobacter gallaeciensis]
MEEPHVRELNIEVTGLSCAGCVGRAERALASVSGVQEASVNLATSKARIVGSSEISAEDLRGALKTAGYPAAEAMIELQISGLTCASCVGRVERALQQVDGVVSADVNLAQEQAYVTYLAGVLTAEDLLKASKHAGYPAIYIGNTQSDADSLKVAKEAEIQRLCWELLIAAALTLPVFVIEMGGHMIPALHHWVARTIGTGNSHILQFLLTTLVLFGPGLRFYRQGVPALLRAAPDMNALVAIGTTAAYGYSVVATFAPRLLPVGTVNVYYEAAAVIVTLILLGRWLEARAKGRTGAAIRALVGLQPKVALVVTGTKAEERPVSELCVGDHLRARPGERIAVDGTVLTGRSFVDESMITGEPVPLEKAAGDVLTAGTINGAAVLDYRATHVGADTLLAQIVRMVEQAQGAKLPVQALVDRVTLWFVPAVIVIAALTVAVWLLFGPDPALPLALVAGVSVLIIACPCAMGLATPTSIMVGIGRAAQMGVLFRKGDALQRLQDTRVVALDKTGTLTEGRPTLTMLRCADGFDRAGLLPLLGAAEAQSEHPIARAITGAAGADIPQATEVEAIPGYGLRATVAGQLVLIGAARLMTREGISCAPFEVEAEHLAARGATTLFAAVDGQLAGLVAVTDPVKEGSRAAVKAMAAQGLKVAMLTGDGAATAQAIADDLGIEIVEANCLPGDKVSALEALQKQHGALAFIGDGINDAPALAAADVGIAIGTGTDVAIEAADIVLVSGDLRGAVNAIKISRATLRNIRQNLGWAFGYNILLVPVAAGILVPFGGPLLSPGLAAGAMAMSSVFVLSNALRLRGLRSDIDQSATPADPTPAQQMNEVRP